MISGVSGVSNMTGVLAVQPYRGAQQYRGYAQVKALSRSTVGQNDVAASAAESGRGAAASSAARQGPKIGAVWSGRTANTGVPVEPVDPVKAVTSNETRGIAYAIPFLRKGMDPAELSVRMRMQYIDLSQGEKTTADKGAPGAAGETGTRLTGLGQTKAEQSAQGVQEVSGEKECRTCKERKYQDGSDDPGVSYQTPTHISPEQAASAVRGHEMEHVVREQASAEREGRRVVSQSVSMHTAICPECGRVYVSGGTTRTTTASDPQPEQPVSGQEAEAA